jgi:hypothetical protein
LDYVYAVQNPRAQGKLMSQKQQSSALIDRLESSYSRCLALTGYLETLADKNALLDR